MWDPLGKEHVTVNLKDAGCDEDTTNHFLQLMVSGTYQDQMQLLRKHRSTLLDELHTAQKRIDCLDYLIYHMQRQNGENRIS